jgi:hypothetical protein
MRDKPEIKPRHHYWLEKSHKDETIKLCRATLIEAGWIESGRMRFPTADAARAHLPPGLIRSWPRGYGSSSVLEYWDEPPTEIVQ